jgi:lactoylglutathione lyase
MPHALTKLTPNLVVFNVERSLDFYCGVLGFTRVATVPDQPPYAFAIAQSGGVELFLNAQDAAVAEYPAFAGKPLGGTLTLFIHVTGIQELYEALSPRVRVVMPLEKKWYGNTEFAFEDVDGYIVTYAERDGA